MPTIFTGIRLAGAASILVLVAAEMVGAKAGLGYLINYAQYNFRSRHVRGDHHDLRLGLVVNQLSSPSNAASPPGAPRDPPSRRPERTRSATP